jgi:tetratricopeptide (TPR) repeat protein
VDARIESAAATGHYAHAASLLQGRLAHDPADRAYILDRLRLLILTLADGQPDAAEITANQTYQLLRTQGLNDDKTAASVVFNERVKVWKGEPFEQALAYAYIAVQKAQRGEWDNARAAAQSSLFLLRDFGENERGERLTAEDLARRAARADADGKSGDDVIDHGYTPVKTDFALGYLLNGLANRALGRDDEASDNFREAAAVSPALRALADDLRSGEYNTVLVVDCGLGPTKAAYGPDDALARFVPRQRAPASLQVSIAAGTSADVPPAQDVNRMAASLAWNNLEDVRVAKSTIGSVLLVGGAAVAAAPQGRNESDEARRNRALIGAGVAILGAVMKSTASADTRHCEFLPAAVFIVPAQIDQLGTTIALQAGDSGPGIVLTGLSPPDGRFSRLQMRYVRLAPGGGAWQGAGRLVYSNDHDPGPVEGGDLPYIMGGRDASRPSPAVLQRYQRAGNLLGFTTAELENLYRQEGITLTLEDQGGGPGVHILEGGRSMVPPLPGTAGYQRLFGQEHRPYEPRSGALRRVLEGAGTGAGP